LLRAHKKGKGAYHRDGGEGPLDDGSAQPPLSRYLFLSSAAATATMALKDSTIGLHEV
jgi:hypothetical protein